VLRGQENLLVAGERLFERPDGRFPPDGVICCGKMTMSRTGIIGTRRTSCFSRLNMQALSLS